jgi:lysine-N-methylase
MTLRLQLPTIQNWSCHNCGGCCREHDILITDAERSRIDSFKWTESDDVPTHVVERAGWFNPRHRLAHRADGSCVFLDGNGLCKIHARFGEAAKPLACRVYPYAFHPAGDQIVVSLRFSCPSVVASAGKSMEQNRDELRSLQKLVVPKGVEQIVTPAINSTQTLEWSDLIRLARGFRQMLDDTSTELQTRVMRIAFVNDMLARARFDKIRGERIDELLTVLWNASADECPTLFVEPTPMTRTEFRLLLAYYARKDMLSSTGRGIIARLRMVAAGLALARGRGKSPALQGRLPPASFASIEGPMSFSDPAQQAGSDELLQRYLSVKLEGLHFCGRAFYNLSFCEGLANLLLTLPLIHYSARWIATGSGRSTVVLDDVRAAVAIIDHNHGYSPALAMRNNRSRIRRLLGPDVLPRLTAWLWPGLA